MLKTFGIISWIFIFVSSFIIIQDILDIFGIHLLQKINQIYFLIDFYFCGAPGGIRTPDPRIRNPVLYPTELLEQKKTECELNPHIEAVLFGSNSKKERQGQ